MELHYKMLAELYYSMLTQFIYIRLLYLILLHYQSSVTLSEFNYIF